MLSKLSIELKLVLIRVELLNSGTLDIAQVTQNLSTMLTKRQFTIRHVITVKHALELFSNLVSTINIQATTRFFGIRVLFTNVLVLDEVVLDILILFGQILREQVVPGQPSSALASWQLFVGLCFLFHAVVACGCKKCALYCQRPVRLCGQSLRKRHCWKVWVITKFLKENCHDLNVIKSKVKWL